MTVLSVIWKQSWLRNSLIVSLIIAPFALSAWLKGLENTKLSARLDAAEAQTASVQSKLNDALRDVKLLQNANENAKKLSCSINKVKAHVSKNPDGAVAGVLSSTLDQLRQLESERNQ